LVWYGSRKPRRDDGIHSLLYWFCSLDGVVMNKYWKAAELIEKHGWTQERFGNNAIGYCMLGALNKATGSKNKMTDDFPELQVAICAYSAAIRNDRDFESSTEAIIALSLAACLEDDK
jgi:hypothetical protein